MSWCNGFLDVDLLGGMDVCTYNVVSSKESESITLGGVCVYHNAAA